MSTAKQRKQLSNARRDAFYALGDAIETQPIDEEPRMRLRLAFVAAALACKQSKALEQLSVSVEGFSQALAAVATIFHQQVADNPEHFIASIIDAANAVGEDDEFAIDNGSGVIDQPIASE